MHNVTEMPLWSVFDQVYRGSGVPTPCSIFGTEEYAGKTKIVLVQHDEQTNQEIYKIVDLYREGVIVCDSISELESHLISFNNVFVATNMYRLGGLNNTNSVYYLSDEVIKIIVEQIEPEPIINRETLIENGDFTHDSDWTINNLGVIRTFGEAFGLNSGFTTVSNGSSDADGWVVDSATTGIVTNGVT